MSETNCSESGDEGANLTALLCCPRCGDEDGCHHKVIERRTLNYTFDGKPNGGSEPHEIRGGTRLYCDNCDLDVTNLVTLNFNE